MKNGGYFPFPNAVVDKLLPKLTGAEFKVFSVVIRQTLGWKKQWDQIANSQFRKKGGLSKSGVMVSLDVLLDNNLILCEKVTETGKLPENWYALFGETNERDRLVRSPDQYDKKTGTLIILELVNSIDQLGDKLVRSPYPQKKALKETNKKKKKETRIFTKQEANDLGIEVNQKIYEIYCVGDSGHKNLIHDIINTHGKQAFIDMARESKAQHINFTEALEWIKTTLSS